MSTSGIIGAQIDRNASLVEDALKSIDGAEASATVRELLPRAVLDLLGPYAAALYIADRVVQSPTFDAERVQALHSKLLPLERMADKVLIDAKERRYFDDPAIAEPLHWLETCNEQVKDCMVALECMLDSQLDEILTEALEEQQRGETVPLDSIP